MESLKQVLMRRDGLTSEEADELIEDAQADLQERLAAGELPGAFCQEWFALEPDYLDDLI